jgi:hypothetical protein
MEKAQFNPSTEDLFASAPSSTTLGLLKAAKNKGANFGKSSPSIRTDKDGKQRWFHSTKGWRRWRDADPVPDVVAHVPVRLDVGRARMRRARVRASRGRARPARSPPGLIRAT